MPTNNDNVKYGRHHREMQTIVGFYTVKDDFPIGESDKAAWKKWDSTEAYFKSAF